MIAEKLSAPTFGFKPPELSDEFCIAHQPRRTSYLIRLLPSPLAEAIAARGETV